MPTDPRASSASPTPPPGPPPDVPPSRRAWLAIVLVLAAAAIAGLWTLGARWSGQRQLFSSLRPITLPTPPARGKAGSTIAPVDQAGVIVVLRDGQTLVSVDRNGRVMGLPDRSADRMRQVAQVLTDGQLPRPAGIEGLASALRPTLASSVPDIVSRPIEPVGTFVRDPRPTFRWRPQLGAAGYRVTIRDEQGAPIETSDVVSTTSWRSPTALVPGRTYTWTVEAEGAARGAAANRPASPAAAPAGTASAGAVSAGAGPAAPAARASRASAPPAAVAPASAAAARFRIIEPDAARALDARLVQARRSNILKGLAFLDVGLLSDAEQALIALSADNEGSERVRLLLEQLRAMRASPATPPIAPTPRAPK